MLRFTLTLVTLLAASTAALADDPHIEIQHVSSAGPLGESTLTLWSDGYVEELSTFMSSSYRFSGQVPEDALRELLAELDRSGLREARFTQQPKHPVLAQGAELLHVRRGAGLHTLQRPPGIQEPNAETQALTATLRAFTTRAAEVLRAHLTEAGPAGRYAIAVLQSAKQPDPQALAELPPAVREALERPGSAVFVPEGQAPELVQGLRMDVGGCPVGWAVHTLGTQEPPGKKQ